MLKKGRLLLLFVFAISAFIASGLIAKVEKANAYVDGKGKEIIYSYDKLDGVSSSESVYPYGKMIEANKYTYIQPVFNGYASTDWTDAQYFSFYVDNRNDVEATIGFCVTSNKQSFTPKIGRTDLVYLDDMETLQPATVKFYNNGVRNGVALPARFKGYVKVKIDVNSIINFDCNVKNGVFNYSTVSMVEFKGSNVFVTALALSYDNDITIVYNNETALMGRKIPAKEPTLSGKTVVDEFVYGNITSTESEYSNYMLALDNDTYNGNAFSLFSYRDWKNVNYAMFYLDNESETAVKLNAKINANGKIININSGAKVYLDDLSNITEKIVDNDGFFEVSGNFKGYVKIPFNTETFTTNKTELVNSLNLYASVENTVFIDNVSIVYDDDISEVFDGIFDNRPYTDFEKEGIDNNVYVMPNFYEVHRGNGYFDGIYGINEAHPTKGDIGNVEYSVRLDSMTVTHKASASGITMWGQNNPYFDSDWRDAKHVIIKIKNELDTIDKFCVIMARTNTYVSNGAIYYLREINTGKTNFYLSATGGYISVPENFDGYLIIPRQSFGDGVDWSNMSRISFMFSSTAGKLTFGIIGKAISDKILSSDYNMNVIDTSIYFEVPDPIPYPTYPERTPTEPKEDVKEKGCSNNIEACTMLSTALSCVGYLLLRKKCKNKGEIYE